jgi:hypothetical protein
MHASKRDWPLSRCDLILLVFSPSSGNGRRKAFASSHGARIHASRASSVVRIATSAAKPKDTKRSVQGRRHESQRDAMFILSSRFGIVAGHDDVGLGVTSLRNR